MADTTWRADAACRNMDTALFFPDNGGDVGVPKTICANCPVRPACLDFALTHHEDHGVWGGESERGRRRIKRQRVMKRRNDTAWANAV